uniref:RING-type domain-containing protein n=1 Tax=Chromera velia CCMP2878 TaxID=1169474 RepID=A0A0G4HQ14_9ALVE|eukprot:Cvel_30042.t1-p1 / transcript=Cvel_30042.t1 / gene=Cvel_30042 / organism=Chromera_velia_CCMP2878 / gene_product=TNF receptor-associated factor 5, putative / transcript_product=TNF receptor-associated factor 5, putative / location=Cvel_scaffold4223:7309-10243(-) / protein_length=460 / sequence_SO=supercontig / SO=protein_coding / is_pseudo=false
MLFTGQSGDGSTPASTHVSAASPGGIRRLGLDRSFAADAEGYTALAENALCPVCHDFLEDVVEVNCSGRHVFCRPCIKEVRRRGKPCPSCRGHFYDIETASPLTRSFIEQVRWKCVNFEQGCTFTGTKREMETHLDEACVEQEVNCSFEGCTQTMKRALLSSHREKCAFRCLPCEHCGESVAVSLTEEHLKECAGYPIECPNGCGEKVPRGDVSAHQSSACPETEVECVVPGCGETRKRKAMETHEEESMGKHLRFVCLRLAESEKAREKGEEKMKSLEEGVKRLSAANTSLKSSMLSWELRVQSLSKENAQLQKRTKDLETKMETVMRDCRSADCRLSELEETVEEKQDTNVLQLTLRLPNFRWRASSRKKGQFLESRPFSFMNYRFSLSIFPKGTRESKEGHCSVWIRPKDPNVRMDFTLTCCVVLRTRQDPEGTGQVDFCVRLSGEENVLLGYEDIG